jgi:maltose-binding protein MalE
MKTCAFPYLISVLGNDKIALFVYTYKMNAFMRFFSVLNIHCYISLAVCILILSVPASATAAEDTTKITINVDTVPDVATTWPPDMARLAVYHEFLRRNPHINVEAATTLRIEGDAAEGNEYLAIAGGIAPDVFYLHGRKIGAFKNQGFIRPLTPFIEKHYTDTGKPFRGIGAPDNIWELCVKCGVFRIFIMSWRYRIGDNYLR